MNSKYLLGSALIFCAIFMVSCNKDYTCKCIDTLDNNKVIDSQIYGNAKEKSAIEECNKLTEINKAHYEGIECNLTVIE